MGGERRILDTFFALKDISVKAKSVTLLIEVDDTRVGTRCRYVLGIKEHAFVYHSCTGVSECVGEWVHWRVLAESREIINKNNITKQNEDIVMV